MKKIVTLLLTIVSFFSLVACSKTTKPTTSKSKQTTVSNSNGSSKSTSNSNGSFWDQDGNGVEDWQEKEITLKFATWAHTSEEIITIDSLMAAAFTEKYPNITVEMQIVGENVNWFENMLALMETNNLPDVFLIDRLANFLPYNMLADLTNYYNNDESTEYIFESISKVGLYEGKRYCIPTFIYPAMWFVNLDILSSKGITAPSYGWTWDQMEAIASASYDETKHILGSYETKAYTYELPKVLKGSAGSSWSALGFDGVGFHFDDVAFEQSFNKLSNALKTNAVSRTLSAEQLTEYYNDSTIDPRYAGYVAVWRDLSWNAKNYMPDLTFEWDVYPGPGGVTGGNTDIAGVSSTCANKAAAYQLLKWMSFGEEGLLRRYDLYEQYNEDLYMSGNNYPYPIVDYGIDGYGVNKVWEAIPYTAVPGMVSPEFIEGLRNGAFQVNKESIGWDAVDYAVGSYFVEIETGVNTFSALKDTIITAADTALKTALQEIKDKMQS